ncbi:hypothetical protein GCM10010168_24210 [Actinoplanes ianthinogenes]|uniref:DUF2332 domain-containing protein n=1 Tax=Actinoplanes ianthinogenes TaxID=122358 RepID=A0ABM7M8Y6_9ACTN|nr:DUF2332 domain-containing protein [Actinoplanes ianthinogenes]BCJ48061.1 hypothetical protein Aiant_87180 [Actinoplanes ianthinogenes]GGR06130.1 hypothetical protein GCM10010168_24210 [Actinoplanes ianthinogenes]
MTVADVYVEFGAREARDVSPSYERLAYQVASDRELLDRLAGLPEPKRQPNLLFAVVRLLGGPVTDPAGFRAFALERWDEIAAQMLVRATQTNEAGRTAALLPVLAALPQPLALIDVGASAGLCLFPDRYAYRYGARTVGAGLPLLDCTATGFTTPTRLPRVVWRAGLDLNPLDVTDPDDVAWLDALIWPEHTHRRERLRQAVAVARADPPYLVRGDAVTDLPALAAQAPAGATLVVFHTSMVYQLPDPQAFADVVRSLPARWVAVEDPALTGAALPAPPSDALYNVLSLDGVPLAWVRGHGQSVTWFAQDSLT